MESPSESHEKPRNPDAYLEAETGNQLNSPPGTSHQTIPVHHLDENTNLYPTPLEPTAREIETGVNDTLAFYEDTTGQTVSHDPLDEDTNKLLFELSNARQKWPASMENEFQAQIQRIHPDIGGSAQYGPL